MTKKLAYTLLWAGIILSLSSCMIHPAEIKDVKYVEVLDFDGTKVSVKADVEISNPNLFDIEVLSTKFDIFADDIGLGEANISQSLVLPSRSQNVYSLTMQGDLSQLKSYSFASLLDLLGKTEPVRFKVMGTLHCKSIFFDREVPVEFTDSVPLKVR